MPFQFDPEYAIAIEPLIPVLSKRAKLTIEDIKLSRDAREQGIARFYGVLPDSPDVEQTVYHIEADDGHRIPILKFSKIGTPTEPGPAIMHYHGGGMILGSAELHAKPLAVLVSETGIPIFSVNYRLAPDYNGAIPVEDCYSGLVWLHKNAKVHGVDPARIAVFGESAGGGLAAGVTLMARDRNLKPRIAKQILVYPMIDDRTTIANEAVEPLAFWKTEDNITAWTALLGDDAGKPDASVSPYVAPARATSLAGLPPTYIDVGELDIFRDESITYATRLLGENISTELHVYPGLPHGFEMVAPFISATARAQANRCKAMLSF
ncbi:Alpha/Beta hydrolase protein [Penicillium sp. IBT 35674x]|nr:Alpha/Beta hydrolase protein [Penicillium sp. IBT 35674x]